MDVFVYGTLTNPAQVAAVVDAYVFVGPAVLEGLHAVEGRYPTLAPGGQVAGRLLRTDAVAAMDAYEGVDSGLYVRVSVPVTGGDVPAAPESVEVYVGDPARLDVAESVTWPGEGPLRERVTRYLAEHEVSIRPIPDS
ncbi:gamma-glutamylcyclotransferase family protein [Salinirubrum litoreum]|uniref:Gamma-glutamylcyclotransferase n=1 Tax=Salinirubrum litoreum TaxID=1126234 RepID=A0ABD5R5M4_9EURY|nr:gamma-glutamylcyclotransferase family protein [Salinirubrum litoreum]